MTARSFRAPQIHVRSLERTEVKVPALHPLQPVRVKKAEPPEVKSAAVRQVRIPDVSVEISPRAAVEIPDGRAVLEGLFKKNTEKEQ